MERYACSISDTAFFLVNTKRPLSSGGAYRNKASSDWQIETCTLHTKKQMSSNDEFMATFVQIRDDQCMHDLAT